ncbi:hypothetical protein JOB18_048938 [Solea senegalensis]|uniref:Uncharacterized protein n=1 Tax=Solea senegalensis TaxID=28829 RepID=A0AAV6SEH7_SOLSE|nr:hypothetical protein JOB18_048938 [Solea senegalensis]
MQTAGQTDRHRERILALWLVMFICSRQSSLTAFPGEPTTSAPKANRITAAFHVSDLEKACIHAAAAAVTPQSDSNPAELRYTEGVATVEIPDTILPLLGLGNLLRGSPAH